MTGRARISIAILVVLLPARARAERLPVQRHGVAEGLAEETVTALLKDSRGSLWIGSLNGLSRYDGERFKVYAGEDGLPKPRVTALAETPDGAIWVATTGGLVRLDPATPAGRPVFLPAPAPPQGKSVDFVSVARGGDVLFGSGGELYRMGKGNAIPLGLAAAAPGNASVRSVQEAADGTIWIGSSRGLFRAAAGGPLVRVGLPGAAVRDVRGVFIDRAGRVWVTTPGALFVLGPGTGGGDLARAEPLLDVDGRVVLPLRGGEARVLERMPGAAPGSWQRPLELRDGRMALSTSAGLVLVTDARLTVYGRSNGLGDGILGELLEDGEGNLWIGTQSTGLLRVAPSGFTSFGEADGLVDVRVGALFEEADGHIVAVSGGNGSLVRLEGPPFRPVILNATATVPIRWVWGRSVLRDRSGAWWIATRAGLERRGAAALGPALERAPVEAVYTARDGLGADEVSALYETRDGTVWAGVYDSPASLARFDPVSRRFVSYGAADGLPATAPVAFVEDRAGDLWIGFGSGGAVRLKSGRFERLLPAHGAPEGYVHDFLLDGAGRLWIANGGSGVLRVDEPAAGTLSAVAVHTSPGTATGTVLCLAEDAAGFLYVGTTRGVERLEPATGRTRHFTTADGLTNNLVTCARRDRTGALWFGTLEGLSRLVPRKDAQVPPPRVAISSFRVNGNPREVPELGSRALGEFVLQPDETRVRIDFAAPGFAAGGAVTFQTRLEGVDASWSPPVGDPTVRYVGLAPGPYRFSVRAIGPLGGEPGEEAAVSFRIRPPLWRRAWFLLLAIAAGVALSVAVHRQSLRRAIAVERVRTRLATDLHDDVGSSLARISILSEVGRRDLDPAGAPARLFGEIGETSRSVIDALGDAIWSIDPRRDDLQSLGDRLRHFAGDLLEARDMTFRLELPPEAPALDVPPEPRRQLFLLLKEAVTNAARHSHATAVSVVFRLVGRSLEVAIADDGAGFDPAARAGDPDEEGRGLLNMQTRAAALGGRLQVETAPGQGTRLVVRGLPLPLSSHSRGA
jgi:signal transduction histidine kinase/ligand-binding sensor domain-containing protein